jgi:Mn2+/Fe2+ NRAMP family transporter
MELGVGWSVILVCLMFSLFYPNIGVVLSYVGAICGFVIIYLLPVLVYLAQSKEEIYMTLRGQADQSNSMVNSNSGNPPPFKIRIQNTADSFLLSN